MEPSRPPSRRTVLQTAIGGGLAAGLGVSAQSVVSVASAAPASAASAATPPAGHGGRWSPNPIVPVPAGADEAERVALAATVRPAPEQVAWQQRRVTAFTHFGMNTFTDREWGTGAEPEATFDPQDGVDVDQWMRSLRAAGATQAMLTVKHHDGFVLFPTRYTNHSVVASPFWLRRGAKVPAHVAEARAKAERNRDRDVSAYWRIRGVGDRNPDGDLLRTYVDAARRAGLRVGIYLSPADGSEITDTLFDTVVAQARADRAAGKTLSIEEQATLEDAEAGRRPRGHHRYVDGSARRERTIPTLIDGDDRAAKVADGTLPSFRVTCDDYNAYYFNTAYEILTQYGRIDEFWLDGANPWAEFGSTQTYEYAQLYRMFAALAPHMRIDSGPAGFRWVGNEDGVALETAWNVVGMAADPWSDFGERLIVGGPSADDLGQPAQLADATTRYLEWLPPECDVSIRPGWFWHPDEQPKSAADLVDLYERSVGHNGTLLINVPPATDGRFSTTDVAALRDFGTRVRRTEARNLLAAGADRLPSGDDRRILTDDRLTSTWSPPHGAATGSVILTLPHPVTFDQLELGEDVSRGQQVTGAAVDAWSGTAWVTIATVTTIGLRRLVTTASRVTTSRLRIRITGARSTPYLSTVAAYRRR